MLQALSGLHKLPNLGCLLVAAEDAYAHVTRNLSSSQVTGSCCAMQRCRAPREPLTSGYSSS